MGFFKEHFGWIFGIADKSIDDIDVEDLQDKLRGAKRLSAKWERDIQTQSAEYNAFINPGQNVNRTSVERKLAIKKAQAAARTVRELTGAVGMLTNLSTTVDRIVQLKKFYLAMEEVGRLPKGMTIRQLITQVDNLGNNSQREQDRLQDVLHVVDSVSDSLESISPKIEGMDELEALFEKIQTLQAEGKEGAPEYVDTMNRINQITKMPKI